MGTVDVLTKDRQLALEAATIVNGYIALNGHLILVRHDDSEFDAGPVAGTNVMGATDTPSLDLTLTGSGTPGAPWNLQGEVLSVKEYEVFDWNDVTTPGWYWSTNALNSPEPSVANWFTGRVYFYPPTGRILQEVRPVSSVNHQNQFVRYWNGGTWSPWALSGDAGRGTTTARDTLFVPPTTDAARVALANQKVRWFNTNLGWEESYYAVTGLIGLTAKGLIAGTASGWYPTGEGPTLLLQPTAAFTATAGAYVGNWHNGTSFRRGGTDWFTYASTGFIDILKPGRYDIKVWTLLVSGTGTANFHLRVLNSAGTTTEHQVDGLAFTLTSTLSVRMHGEYHDVPISAPKKVALFCHSGNVEVHTLNLLPRAQFEIRYRGPLLVSD